MPIRTIKVSIEGKKNKQIRRLSLLVATTAAAAIQEE